MGKGMSGRDLKSWIGRAEQKALLRAIATGGPQHFALTLDDFDYGVTSNNPFVLAGAALLLCVIALSASLLPVRKAVYLDPVEALRTE
jgi:ABC-type lipoprotein release transport system permease subunit